MLGIKYSQRRGQDDPVDPCSFISHMHNISEHYVRLDDYLRLSPVK